MLRTGGRTVMAGGRGWLVILHHDRGVGIVLIMRIWNQGQEGKEERGKKGKERGKTGKMDTQFEWSYLHGAHIFYILK